VPCIDSLLAVSMAMCPVTLFLAVLGMVSNEFVVFVVLMYIRPQPGSACLAFLFGKRGSGFAGG
jgi:hypothetical protein